MKKEKVLFVAQTPPPYYGQSIMNKYLVDGHYSRVEIFHLRMSYSNTIDSIGKFHIYKIFHLFKLIIQTYKIKRKHGITSILYPVAGPFLIPIIRDIIYLGFVRTLFDKIILEFSAAGISEYLESHSYFLRWVAKKIYNSDGAFQKSKFNPADAKYFNAKQIYYIPNGIPDEASTLHPIPRSKSLPVEILYIGIIRESKGVLILLEALAILRDRGKSVHGTFIGEFISNKAKRKIIKYISDNNLQTVVTLPGVKTGNDKWQYFMKSDIFCFPSFYENESFGIVIIEAMMFGLPVVSTDWRAIPGIVDNDVNGFLIPVKNPEALSEKLEILVENLELRNNMGKNGRKKFLNEYLLSIYLRRHEKAILEIIGAN